MDTLTKETIDNLNIKDDTAFEIMFKFYYPRLVYFAREYVSYEVAKGLTQEAFITFLETPSTFSNEAQLRCYLYTLVKNNCLMRIRHEKVKKKYVANSDAVNLQNQINQSALEQLDTSEVTFREMESIIHETIQSLCPQHREVFLLSRDEGKKYREIALDLNISIKTVEARMTRVLKLFRVALIDYLPFIALLFINFELPSFLMIYI